MDLEIIKAIQLLRNPLLDWFFYLVTQIGDQYVFIVLAAVIYWTINKKFAHKFVLTFMISALVNSSLKEIFKRTRPFHLEGVSSEPSWETTGYSFPSGHSQAAGVLGYTAYSTEKTTGKKWIWYIGIGVLILVPLSRVYLGQHYLSDVVVGVLLAFTIAHFMFKLIDKMNDKEHIYTIMLVPVFIILMFFVKNTDMYVAAGGFIGFSTGYYLEKEYVKFDVKASFWIQVLKVVIGLFVAIAIKEGLKFVFPYSVYEDIEPTMLDLFFDFVRYLMIGVWAAVGAPWVFKHAIKHR